MKRYHLLSLGLVVILVSILTGCTSITVTNTVTKTQNQTLTETQIQLQTLTITPPTVTETVIQTVTVASLLEHNTTYQVARDVEYCQVGERSLVLDIYIPDEPIISPAPAVVWIHGGGWRAGGKSLSRDYILMLVEHGFTLVSIEYRLSSEAIFPAAIEDCKCAVRWLRAHAQQYNVDPERIGVWGGSAGGHLAMMVACSDESAGIDGNSGWNNQSSRVQAACSYWGVSDLVVAAEPFEQDISRQNVIVQFLGGLPSEIPEIYELASPVTHVSLDDPPLLLVHGDKDPVVSLRQSQIIHQAYLELSLETELIVVYGAGHGLKQMTDNSISPSREVVDQIVLEFFMERLVIQVSNN